MKYKTTKKAVMSYYDCFSIGYCELQNLLRFAYPESYTSGVYGWNADVYNVNGCAIVTGYRPFGKSVDYNIVKKYERKAEKIFSNNNKYKKWKTKENAINKLLVKFIEEIKK